MKTFLTLVLACFLAVCLVSCGNNTNELVEKGKKAAVDCANDTKCRDTVQSGAVSLFKAVNK